MGFICKDSKNLKMDQNQVWKKMQKWCKIERDRKLYQNGQGQKIVNVSTRKINKFQINKNR